MQREQSGSLKAPYGARAVRGLCDARKIPFVERGNRRFIAWGDFVDYVEAQRVLPSRSTSPPTDAVDRRAVAAARAREGLAKATT